MPLSYSSVDQRKFFKRPEKESIKDVLAALESAKEGPKWPFQIDESCPWVAANQPQTHVQVIRVMHIFLIYSIRKNIQFLHNLFFLGEV